MCKFGHLLENRGLAKERFKAANQHLHDKGLKRSQGMIVNATILRAWSSTKNWDTARRAETYQTKHGDQWRFGIEEHIGVGESRDWRSAW